VFTRVSADECGCFSGEPVVSGCVAMNKIRVLHFADIHMGVENYTRVDPATGLSQCLLDFQRSFDEVVDFALGNEIDLVVFSGDAYKSREPSQTHQREFARRIARLASAGIPVFLLVGNHDLPNAVGRATALEIFDTLAVQNVVVANQPGIHLIRTRRGPVQVAALPWVRRSSLLSREDTRQLKVEELRRKLEETLGAIIRDLAERLDPDVPAVLSAHLSVADATLSSERTMVLGQDPVLPLASVADAAFDYVALGHIHKCQVLCQEPLVAYSGSLQRIDFGEEEDAKGFYVVEIDPGGSRGARATLDFCPVNARRFLTIKASVAADDLNPTATVLEAIARRSSEIAGAIVKVQVAIPEHIDGLVQEADIYDALSGAQYVCVNKDVEREGRTRTSGWAVEEMGPIEALRLYLGSRNASAERTRTLLEYAERLIRETTAEG